MLYLRLLKVSAVKINVVVAKDKVLREAIFRQRYEVFCKEFGYLDPDDYPDGMESDPFDAYSDHIAAFDEKGVMVGSIRLLHHSPIGYPTQISYDISQYLQSYDPQSVSELSRIIIAPGYRGMLPARAIVIALYQTLYKRSQELGISVWVGNFERRFIRLLRLLGLRFTIIGEGIRHHSKMRLPAVLTPKRMPS
jgi:N-acyl-L-homoserine lactone synthetase